MFSNAALIHALCLLQINVNQSGNLALGSDGLVALPVAHYYFTTTRPGVTTKQEEGEIKWQLPLVEGEGESQSSPPSSTTPPAPPQLIPHPVFHLLHFTPTPQL